MPRLAELSPADVWWAMNSVLNANAKYDIELDPTASGYYPSSDSYATDEWAIAILDKYPEMLEKSQDMRITRITQKNVKDAHTAIDNRLPPTTWFTEGLNSLLGPIPFGISTIAAHSGCGKTAFAMNQIAHFEECERGCYVWPLEVAPDVAMRWFAGMKLGIPRFRQVDGDLTDTERSELKQYVDDLLDSYPIWAGHSGMTDVNILTELAKAQEYGFRNIIIDHIHHVTIEQRDTVRGMERLVRDMSDFAHEKKMRILMFAQFRKGLERGAKWRIPDPEMIKGAAAIVEVSESVVLISRAVDPDKLDAWRNYTKGGEVAPNLFEKRGAMVVSLAKSRSGKDCNTVEMTIANDKITDGYGWDDL